MSSPDPSTAAVPAGALRRALIETTLVQIVSTATALALTVIAPLAALDIGVGAHWIGYQVSLIYMAGVFSSAVAGTLVERHGAHRIEQIALMTFALGLAGLAVGKLPAIVLASILIGLGYGLQNPAASHILNAVAPAHRRNLVFSIKQAGVPLGGVVASLGFPFIATLVGWKTGFLCGAAFVAGLAYLFGRNVEKGRSREGRGGFLAGLLYEQQLIWGHPKLRAAALIGMFYSSVQLCLSAFVVVMLVEQAGWSLMAAGGLAAAIQVFGACGRVLWGAVADRTGRGFSVLAAVGAVSAACAGALAWLPLIPAPAQVALLCVMGLCVSGWNGVVMAEITRHSPEGQTGRVIGGALVYTFLGVMLGPSAFAVIYDLIGNYGRAFALFGVVAALGTFLAFWSRDRRADR